MIELMISFDPNLTNVLKGHQFSADASFRAFEQLEVLLHQCSGKRCPSETLMHLKRIRFYFHIYRAATVNCPYVGSE